MTGAALLSPATRLLLGILLALQVLYGIAFIARTTFEIDGVRYFCLFDDAMITMAYGKNFVDGFGLNWAKYGEPVEGYTHPLWLLVCMASNLPGTPLHIRSLFVQLASLLLLVACALLVFRIMLELQENRGGTDPSWVPAVVLTMTYYPLTMWSLQGMESALQACLVLMRSATSTSFSTRTGPSFFPCASACRWPC